MKTKGSVGGIYNEHGYTVFLNGAPFYTAGNNRWDSQSEATCDEARLPIATLRDYCRNTCKEIASEQNAKFIGVRKAE